MNAASESTERSSLDVHEQMPPTTSLSFPHEVFLDGVCIGKYENFRDALDSAQFAKTGCPGACVTVATFVAEKLISEIDIKA